MKKFQRKIDNLGNRCCGCGVCAALCPKDCIAMVPDDKGFVYPKIDKNACIGCGACDQSCPVQNSGVGIRDEEVDALWAKSLDKDMLASSSSGAIFGELAQQTLRACGVVYGAAFTDDCKKVLHKRINDVRDLNEVMRSKYLQGRVNCDVYECVRQDLVAGCKVLYSGVACQIAAMRNYLGPLADSNHLLCIDMICHGVPSPKLWVIWLR